MYYATRASALSAALRSIDRTADPDRLIEAARNAGMSLPIESGRVTSPSLAHRGSNGMAYRVPPARHDELIKAVDALTRGSKAAA